MKFLYLATICLLLSHTHYASDQNHQQQFWSFPLVQALFEVTRQQVQTSIPKVDSHHSFIIKADSHDSFIMIDKGEEKENQPVTLLTSETLQQFPPRTIDQLSASTFYSHDENHTAFPQNRSSSSLSSHVSSHSLIIDDTLQEQPFISCDRTISSSSSCDEHHATLPQNRSLQSHSSAGSLSSNEEKFIEKHATQSRSQILANIITQEKAAFLVTQQKNIQHQSLTIANTHQTSLCNLVTQCLQFCRKKQLTNWQKNK